MTSITNTPPNTDCICLIGLTGAGKTTVGKQLGKRLGRPFHDSDHEIEARTGVSVREIFEVEGEEGFRDREEAMIRELVQRKGIVLATGGGGILRESTRQLLHQHCAVIYLLVTPEEIFKRIGHDRSRPMLNGSDPLQRLRELHTFRDPLYRETTHFIAETHGRSPQAIAMIEQWLATLGLVSTHATAHTSLVKSAGVA